MYLPSVQYASVHFCVGQLAVMFFSVYLYLTLINPYFGSQCFYSWQNNNYIWKKNQTSMKRTWLFPQTARNPVNVRWPQMTSDTAANVGLFGCRVDNCRTSGESPTRRCRSCSSLWQCNARRPMPSGRRSASCARKAAMFSLNTCCPPRLRANASCPYLAAFNSPSPSLGPVGNDQASLPPTQEWPSFLFCQPTRAAPGLDYKCI